MLTFDQTRLSCALFGTFILAGILNAGAHASIIQIESQPENSTEQLGAFEGTIEYIANPSSNTQGLLTISLINTTTPEIGGFITGFVFNFDSSDPDATATLASYTHPFVGVTDHMAPPFGMSFDAGAALDGNWSGGGNPNPGIAVGDTGTFAFDVFAADAHTLTANSFMSGPYDFNFVVRFRGMAAGGSDKVPGGSISVVPAPGALAVLFAAGLFAPRRRAR